MAVVGAGVAGLAAAHALGERAAARGVALKVAIFEAGTRAGGVLRTGRRDGFLLESGPDCFITDKPWGIDLCRRLGLGDELAGTNPDCRRSFILSGRRLLPVPEGFSLMAPARLRPFLTTPTLSLMGRLRAGLDLVKPRGPALADESLASFVRRRFGDEVLERLAQPLLAGIYNADPERLSLRATMPRFLELERDHRSVILGLRRGRRRAGGAGDGTSGARYSLFVAPRRGMGSIVERLVDRLPAGALHLGARVAALGAGRERRWALATERDGGSDGAFEADAVVLALGAPSAAPILRAIDATAADALAAIPYGSSTTVNLAWSAADLRRPLDGFGFVVPRREKRRLIACSFTSVKFPGRAPEGSVLVRAFTGDEQMPGADADAVSAAMREELRDILGIEAAPIFSEVTFHRAAMPRYEVGHLGRAAEIASRIESQTGLAFAGNALTGVGVPDCIRSGEAAAERILSRAPHLVS